MKDIYVNRICGDAVSLNTNFCMIYFCVTMTKCLAETTYERKGKFQFITKHIFNASEVWGLGIAEFTVAGAHGRSS